MSQDIFDCMTSTDRKRPSCRCCHPDWRPADDVEVAQLFEDLAQTLFSVMDHHDADILVIRGARPDTFQHRMRNRM